MAFVLCVCMCRRIIHLLSWTYVCIRKTFVTLSIVSELLSLLERMTLKMMCIPYHSTDEVYFVQRKMRRKIKENMQSNNLCRLTDVTSGYPLQVKYLYLNFQTNRSLTNFMHEGHILQQQM